MKNFEQENQKQCPKDLQNESSKSSMTHTPSIYSYSVNTLNIQNSYDDEGKKQGYQTSHREKEGTTNDVTDDHNSFIARVKA